MNGMLWWQVIHKDQQTGFYQNCSGGLDGGANARKMLDELLESTDTRSEYFQDGGEFLPLSVWAVRGFDTDRIAANTRAEDRKDDMVLGLTFRVRILSKGNSGVRATARISRGTKRSAPETSPVPVPVEQLALEDAVAKLALENAAAKPSQGSGSSNDSSSSSSNSSSSSSDHKKKKKHSKKSKKDKKSKKQSKKEKKLEKKLKKAYTTMYISIWGVDYALHVMRCVAFVI
jgi:hypothetical protein